jgi:hypothetical protein
MKKKEKEEMVEIRRMRKEKRMMRKRVEMMEEE